MINLEMQVNKTPAGLYTVTFGYKQAPLDVQEGAFAVHGLHTVSPAEFGFLRAQGPRDTFNLYSRTDADVLYDNRTNQVVIVPNGAISRQVSIANLVDAHRRGKEYVIPENQRDLVYAMVDEMLRNNIAFVAPHGETGVPTAEFGKNDLTLRLFSDKRLGIEAQEYGDWQKERGIASQSIFLDNADYAQSQEGLYLNRLRVCGSGGDFDVDGGSRGLVNNFGAFGVRFEKTAVGGVGGAKK